MLNLKRNVLVKIAHESPVSIFHWMQNYTDYDYALVHLFEESKEYYDCFERALLNKREVILDNSIFELGTAFDTEKYIHWINKLKPTWYIIPDVLEDCQGTIDKFYDWQDNYSNKIDKSVKRIGVVQGLDYYEIIQCYKLMEPEVDKIAISFDYSMYNDGKSDTKYHCFMRGRQQLIDNLIKDEIINVDKPHHLLGCALPQEFDYYKDKKYSFIDSVDTSNPVVHGINRVRYEPHGLNKKIKTKLVDYMFEIVNFPQLSDIEHNLNAFRNFCK